MPNHARRDGNQSVIESQPMSLEEALEVAGWPKTLLTPDKQPEIMDDLAQFEHQLLFGSHIDRVLVVRGGVRRLNQSDALPPQVIGAAAGESSVRRFLAELGKDDELQELRGRLYYTPPDTREEQEITKNSDGTPLDTLADKRAALEGYDPDGGVYVGELRQAQKYRHQQDGRFSKSLLRRGVCDWIGRTRAFAMPYWDRYDEGVFVGGRFGGSPMHVDQVLWSNVGKSFAGYKLLVIWPYGGTSRSLFDKHCYTLFVPPLSRKEETALEQAKCVALLGPGDIVAFSGGNAHMALSVSEALSITAYESFVNLNPANLRAFLDSGTDAQYRQCRTRQPTLDDIKLDVAASLNDLAGDMEEDELQDIELEEAAPAALEVLRSDPLIATKVIPLRPKRRRLA